jgi:LysM repeat protein
MRAHRTLTTTAAAVALAFLALLGTGTHTVARGETLAGIAARYGTTTAELASANGISNPNRIYVGTRLVVPGAAAAPGAVATASYTVQRGDTLGSIASRAGTTIATVVALNGIKNPNLIRIGQVLSLPGSAAAPGSPAPAAPAGGATFHVVTAGETISGIAARYGITQAQLIGANGLTDGRIYTGQRLTLLPATAPVPTPAPTSTYTVAAGDTLSSIAQRFGTTIKALQDANGITDPDRVVLGTKLTIPGSGGGSATLRCPVAGGRFMNDWGFPRSGGRFHEGNDIFAPRGTPAVAVVGGTVVQTTGAIGGKQVKLAGDDGASYYYTHLDSFGAGGRVEAGAVIGTVGNTGNAAGGPTHVHFEVHPGAGAAVNPYPRIAAVC